MLAPISECGQVFPRAPSGEGDGSPLSPRSWVLTLSTVFSASSSASPRLRVENMAGLVPASPDYGAARDELHRNRLSAAAALAAAHPALRKPDRRRRGGLRARPPPRGGRGGGGGGGRGRAPHPL